MQPPASHAQSAHACGLSRVFSDVHAAGKHDLTLFRRLRTAELCEAPVYSDRSASSQVSARKPISTR